LQELVCSLQTVLGAGLSNAQNNKISKVMKSRAVRTRSGWETIYFTCYAAALLVTGNALDIQTLLQPVSSQLFVRVLKICFPKKKRGAYMTSYNAVDRY